MAVQMSEVNHYEKKKQEEAEQSQQPKNESFGEYGTDEDQNQPDYYINVSLRDASRAIEIYRDINIIPRESVRLDGTDSYVIDDLEIAQELLSAFQEQDIEIIDTDVPAIDSEYDTDYEDELDEKVGQVVDKSTGDTVQLFRDPSKAQQFVNTQPSDVRSQLIVRK